MINIAILGFGVVGSGVAEVIEMNRESIKKKLGDYLNVKYILDIRDFKDSPYADRVIRDISVIVNDPEVVAVAETMGGSHPAFEFSMACLEAGKHVVTSNKELVAKFGHELIRTAQKNKVAYMFEASVGGGIPVIRPMARCLAANEIVSIAGILNGTTNYILTQMAECSKSFEEALSEAQKKGYAERDPSADINGIDTCRKISILTDIAFGKFVDSEKVHTEGITNVRLRDIKLAEKWGGSVKLLGVARKEKDGVYVIVCPFFVKNDKLLSGINDVYNGIEITGNAVETVTFCGRGAGKLPTASAVTADIIDAVRTGSLGVCWTTPEDPCTLLDTKKETSAYYADISGACVDSFAETILDSSNGSTAIITRPMTAEQLDEFKCALEKTGGKIESLIRIYR